MVVLSVGTSWSGRRARARRFEGEARSATASTVQRRADDASRNEPHAVVVSDSVRFGEKPPSDA